MNSDVLVFNRLFRFVPGIAALTRLSTRLDAWTSSLPGLARAGLQVIGVAEKPEAVNSALKTVPQLRTVSDARDSRSESEDYR
jgi:hypothetical protein